MLDASVVIPVLNDSSALITTLPAVIAQIGSRRVEIIVVDNGSLDDSIQVAEHFGARVLREHLRRASPYSSRNRGIDVATGQVIILLDATCTPETGWFEAGMASLREKKATIVGGRVRFSFGSSKPTPAELFDSMVHVQMQESIEQHGCAMTANLFIHRDVFSRQGLFHEGIRSGEDLRWTKAAGQAGEVLVYCHEAVVRKPARCWPALRQKVTRTAGGAVSLLGPHRAVYEMTRNMLLPPNPLRTFSLVKAHYPAGTAALSWRVFLVSWRLRWVRASGMARALLGFSGRPRETGALASE
jgi:glycosyltransferase involved in cell wall biosynthesis